MRVWFHIIAVFTIVLPLTLCAQVSTIVTTGSNPIVYTPVEEQSLTMSTKGQNNIMATVNIPPASVIPTIDGVFSPGEWADAVTITPATVVTPGCLAYMKSDACYIYVAAVVMGPTYYQGNSTMINIWLDMNRNGQWNLAPGSPAGNIDGNLALPAPGDLYPANVAVYGYHGLPGWSGTATSRLRFHYPWWTPALTPIPESQIMVRRVQVSPSEMRIEARIEYINSPFKITDPPSTGLTANMRIQWYAGYFTLVPYTGVVQIQAQYPPPANGSAYFTGPLPTELTDFQRQYITSAANTHDVDNVTVLDNPAFSAPIWRQGDDVQATFLATTASPPQTVNYQANFYGPYPSTALFTTTSGSVVITQPSQTVTVSFPVTLPPGFFQVEIIADDPEPCGTLKKKGLRNGLFIGPGQIPCVVWPGEVNLDGIVNYGDREALKNYIHEANLRDSWLMGPGRLPPNFPFPMAALEWIAQPAIPWATTMGCYTDTDGNGVINNFDYLAIKTNFMQWNSTYSPKENPAANPKEFNILQNFPNPFNPSTSIHYTLPERSDVVIEVTNPLGQRVATLVNQRMDFGIHQVTFNGDDLPSGSYVATISALGVESGLRYTKSIKMALIK